MMADIQARLCVLRKWPDFQGFGFNLHGEKNKTGHFIGTVEDGSPAYSCGLLKGDRLIEVNGTNVTSRSHGDVVQLIRSAGERVEMLVMTEEEEKAALSHGIVVSSSGDNIRRIEAADSLADYEASRPEPPAISEERSEEEQRKYEEEIADSVAAAAMAADSPAEADEEEEASKQKSDEEEPAPVVAAAPVPDPEPAPAPAYDPAPVPAYDPAPVPAYDPAPAPAAAQPTANGKPALTAAEFRAQLKSKKKNDPRQNPASFRDKTLMFQQM